MAGRENGESGALSPLEAAQGTYKTGLRHLNEPSQLAFVKNVYGGSLLSSGGMLALTASVGASVLQESNTRIYLFRRSRAIYIAPILVLHSAL